MLEACHLCQVYCHLFVVYERLLSPSPLSENSRSSFKLCYKLTAENKPWKMRDWIAVIVLAEFSIDGVALS